MNLGWIKQWDTRSDITSTTRSDITDTTTTTSEVTKYKKKEGEDFIELVNPLKLNPQIWKR